ncbi:MAG TPA: carboxypeptidase-like regulatory domain-containing protein [Candidatus Sulfotelmatobacter sp.]|nr:carboxypeptidase-like regulatory domain-containing protein [Candidatus Sulfotelmatobacter sp.]
MKPGWAKVVFTAALASVLVLHSGILEAQDAIATISGTVTDAFGKVVPNATVSVKNVTTGQSRQAQTNSNGIYTAPDLAPGDYEIFVTATGFDAKSAKVTLAAGTNQTADLMVTAAQAQSPAPPTPATSPASSENLPNAPSSTKPEPSLQDLGFSAAETQGNAKQQALLDKRTHMLKIHQRLGLITTIPLVASIVSSAGAGGKSTSTTSRDLHVALGGLTGDLYFITAYYAIRAPRVAGSETRGPIRVHKALAWIHGPGMVLTPILGIIAFNQKSSGEKVHGLGAAHLPVALVTAGAYGAALLSVSVKF